MTTPTHVCDTCNEPRADVRPRDNGSAQCSACWADSLAFGHFHGMHTDEDGEPLHVHGCPSCDGRTPEPYRACMTTPTNTRRSLMDARSAALRDGDIATFQRLTRQIADLPLRGVSPLTQRDIDRYAKHGQPKAGR